MIIYLPIIRGLSMFKTIFTTIVGELWSFCFFFMFSIVVFAIFFSIVSQGEAGMISLAEDENYSHLWEACQADENCNRYNHTNFYDGTDLNPDDPVGRSDVAYFGPYQEGFFYMPAIWIYRSVLGDFDFVGYFANDVSALNALVAWIIFVLAVFITQFIMLNLVIAIIE